MLTELTDSLIWSKYVAPPEIVAMIAAEYSLPAELSAPVEEPLTKTRSTAHSAGQIRFVRERRVRRANPALADTFPNRLLPFMLNDAVPLVGPKPMSE